MNKKMLKSDLAKGPILELLKPLVCDICGELSLKYVQTIEENGEYAVIRQCKNHEIGVGFLQPLDEFMGKLMIYYDKGLIDIGQESTKS